MDGLSGAASVIAVIDIAHGVGSALKDYYEGVREARDDIQKLYNAVKSLEGVLSLIQDILNQDGDHLVISEAIAWPLRQAELELLKLRLELDTGPKSTRFGNAVRSLTWPFKKKDVEKAVVTIERHKSSLNLGIGVENLTVALKNFDISDRARTVALKHFGISNRARTTALKHFDISVDIRSDIRAARDDASRRRIVDWLSSNNPDPSKYHNIARGKHEDTTGTWLIDGEDFNAWLTTPNSFMWLNGGAGSGKSILCSTAIDRAQEISHAEPNSVALYWYFTFADLETQNVSNALCSLIADICSNRRDTPAYLQETYDRANYGQQKPAFKSCLAMLKEVATGFSNIYLFLDALDECPKLNGDRERLLAAVNTIHSWNIDCFHIFSSSRREPDIEESFRQNFKASENFRAVGVQGHHVDNDIRKYLQHSLRNRQFLKWRPDLRRDVEDFLAARADGMFRLVGLQLDILGKVRIESQIRQAMKELPKTLDSFYDRILQGIDETTNQRLAHLAFQWLAFSPRPISLKELAEAVVVRPEQTPYFRNEDRFFDHTDLLEIFPSGLVIAVNVSREHNNERDKRENDESSGEESETNDDSDPGDQDIEYHEQDDETTAKLMVQFAHFSVKEYLISERISAGPASNFHLRELVAHDTIAKSTLSYLLHVGSELPPIATQLFTDYPLLHYSANCWQYHLRILDGKLADQQRDDLLFEFLTYSSYAWKIWAAVGFDDLMANQYHTKPEAFLPALPYRIPNIANFPSQIHPITWLSCLGLVSPLQILLRENAILDNIPQTSYFGNPLYISAWSGNLYIVRMLLAAGSNVNRQGGRFQFALNAACVSGKVEIVKTLLDAGAEINHTGPRIKFVSALELASMTGNMDVIRVLIDSGADVNGGDDGVNALQAACARGDVNLIKRILRKGIDVNSTSSRGKMTALDQAAAKGDLDMVQFLVQNGARITGQTKRGGFNALATAVKCGNRSVVDYLQFVLEAEKGES